MDTLPPAGLAPTIPPPPRHRAQKAVALATAGIVLLAAALLWRWRTQTDAANVLSYGNDAELGAFFRRLLFGLSGGSSIAAVVCAYGSFRHARAMSSIALLLSTAWLAVVLVSVLG